MFTSVLPRKQSQLATLKISSMLRTEIIEILILYFFFFFFFFYLTLSRPLDVNYVLEQGQGHGHLSKYLISGLIFHFFHVYMKKKNFKPFSKNNVS